uniref:Ig-like domain-containing protein n=1 Tax=Capra hircus TaxID=9925 RepID=A0A452EG68_CAPHI
MKRLAGTVLGLLFAQVCCVRGLDVEQSPPALSLQEGASHMLRCNFSGSVSNVQWYLQNPSGRLIQLFNVPSGTKQDGRLKATTIPKERRSSLHISSSQTTDSGTYFCAAQHSAPQAPAACTQTLRGLSPSFSHSHTVRPPQGICSVGYFLPTLVQF